MVGVLNGKKGKAFSVVVVAVCLLGVFGGLVTKQSLGYVPSVFYDEEGSSFWINNSWDSGTKSISIGTNSSFAYSGNKSCQIDLGTVGGSWGTVSWKHDFVFPDFGKIEGFSLWIYSNISTTDDLTVVMQNNASHLYSWLVPNVYSGWVEYSFWLKSATKAGGPSFNRVSCQIYMYPVLTANRSMCVDYGRVFLASDVADSSWLGVGVSFGLVAVALLLALKSRSWAVNFLFGLSLVGFLGWQFANASVELFGGWLDFMVLVGAVLVLVKGAVLVRASGV